MRVAIIDLGTNSVRFDVHQISPQGKARALHREKLMVRLGQGVFTQGKLNSEAVRRTLRAFVSFERTAQELSADRVVAFGTAALREAADGAELLSAIRARTGIEIRVISGKEEAKLIALGILRREKLPKGRFGLIDIGGGSTEISVCRGREIVHADSFPLGTARLQQVFLRSSPPRPPHGASPGEDPVEHLRRYIRGALLPTLISEEWPKVGRLIGSSGTVRALAKLLKKGEKSRIVDRGGLRKLVKQMSRMNTTELLGLPGMEPKRVDMILAGAVLLEECMNLTGAKKVHATEFSLRDGILEEQRDLLRTEKKTSLAYHLQELREHVARIHPKAAHPYQVSALGDVLFDRLRALHRLGPDWKPRLSAAALLHDLGELISPTNHEQHSYYFVKNSDFTAFEKWESEFIARLCLYHRGGVPEFGKFGDLGKNQKEKRQAFTRLLAILRVADALDRSHGGSLRIRSVKIRKYAVDLVVTGHETPDLELLRIEQKKGLFEEVFKRELAVKYVRARARRAATR